MIQQSHSRAYIWTKLWYMYPYVHSSAIHYSQDMKQPKCPSTEQWIKKMEYYYTILILQQNTTQP